ncbi:sugar kinase [Alkalihalobacillus sp. BA299]|uniref:sugar kinase n=1 Tax=Alkalihalobacillus sp. BA299 TaxID=2815938 RepID=UPI001ADCE910|nr:sugar kinase [Alkalihalobacillus sp. BA299]
MAKILTIGELLLRLTPVQLQRLNQTRELTMSYGGAEANVAVSLSQFGHHASLLSVIPANDLGEAALSHLKAFGVDTSSIFRGGERLGLYFYEQGFSSKQAKVIYDRKYSSILELPNEKIDWDQVYAGVDILHTTGITPALSEKLQQFTIKAIQEAKKRKVQISFDFNYRAKLWSIEKAKETFLSILPYVDICFVGYKDFKFLLGNDGPEHFTKDVLENWYRELAIKYEISYLVCTNRTIISSSKNEIVGYVYFENCLYESERISFEILDRIGGGDAFAAGVLHGIAAGYESKKMIEFAVSSSVLKHTVYGDHNQFSVDEVKTFVANRGGDVNR